MQKFTTFYQAGFENVQNFSIFTCKFSSGWGPYPNLKVLLCEKMHDHLVIRCFPARQVFGRLRAGLFVLVSRFVYIKNYLAAPFGHCHNLISSSNHLELKSIRLWNHVVQQKFTTLLNVLGMRVFWGTPHKSPKKVINLKVYKFKNYFLYLDCKTVKISLVWIQTQGKIFVSKIDFPFFEFKNKFKKFRF